MGGAAAVGERDGGATGRGGEGRAAEGRREREWRGRLAASSRA